MYKQISIVINNAIHHVLSTLIKMQKPSIRILFYPSNTFFDQSSKTIKALNNYSRSQKVTFNEIIGGIRPAF